MKIKSISDLKSLKNAVQQMPIKQGKQTKLVTRYLDVINPESFDDYISIDGFFALEKALSLTQDDVIKIVTDSKLRGRGGGGFLTGKKWEFAEREKSTQKYVICNCDEGDPGAFMDRAIIEGNPFAIVEGLAIAGYAIGANHGVVYVRAEYPVASQRIKNAVKIAREYGLLGDHIFESDFDFDVDVVLGAGAFVCGEETALIKSCEGGRGEPNKKPPYPAHEGLFTFPTIINNVETLANVPLILLNGSEWFTKFGTEKSTGTKVFALSGAVKNAGLFEVEMGTTIKTLVEELGGGTLDGNPFKAVQLGGPSGGALPYSEANTPLDYDSLLTKGAMMGSGGVIVMDSGTCMVDITKFFLEFSCDESCGKCTPCRIGNKRMLEILTKICEGKGTDGDIEKLEKLCHYVKETSLCGLGQTSPNPVLSALKYFRNEFNSHVHEKTCKAGVCKNLVHFEITNKCVACSACKRICPVGAISGELKKPPFVINDNICIRCSACAKTCPVKAIIKK